MKCPNCNHEVDAAVKFCSECGYSFESKSAWNNNRKFYITLGVAFLAFVMWLYAPSRNQASYPSADSSVNSVKNDGTNPKPKAADKSANGTEVDVNTPFSNENVAEVTVKRCEFTNKVMPDNPRSYYSYYQAEEGKTNFVVVADVKNLMKESKELRDLVKVTLLYDEGEYNYSTYGVMDRKGDLDSLAYLDPLNPGKIKFRVEVPESVENDGKPIKVQFMIGNKKFIYKYR